MLTTEQTKTSAWLRVAGAAVLVVAAVAVGWQLTGDHGVSPAPEPPAILDDPVVTVSGSDPVAWVVAISPGDGEQFCGHGEFGRDARTWSACSVLVGPADVGNELFGSGTSRGDGDRTLTYGLVDPDVVEVVVELADGREEVATVATGALPSSADAIAVWAYATDGEVVARIARTADGTEERVELTRPG